MIVMDVDSACKAKDNSDRAKLANTFDYVLNNDEKSKSQASACKDKQQCNQEERIAQGCDGNLIV